MQHLSDIYQGGWLKQACPIVSKLQNSHDNILVICTCLFVGKSDLIYLANLFFLPWLTICWCNVFSSGTTEPGTDMLSYIFQHQGKNEQLPKVERVLD